MLIAFGAQEGLIHQVEITLVIFVDICCLEVGVVGGHTDLFLVDGTLVLLLRLHHLRVAAEVGVLVVSALL